MYVKILFVEQFHKVGCFLFATLVPLSGLTAIKLSNGNELETGGSARTLKGKRSFRFRTFSLFQRNRRPPPFFLAWRH